MIVTALIAAVLYGAGAAAEQRQAAAAPESSAGRPRLLVLLARQPLWLAGIAAQIGGFAAHAVALWSGPLATVQMLVALELVVAVVIVRRWSGRPLRPASWAAALTVMAGIAAFLALTSRSSSGHGADLRHHAVGAALGAGIAGGCAVAAGLADACSAVVTMAFAHVAGHGLVVLFTSWTVYALVVCGAGNVLLTQSAYQTGRPLITLPVISAVTPVVSVAIGIGLLGETPRIGVAGAVGAGLAVVVTSVALAWLARSAPVAGAAGVTVGEAAGVTVAGAARVTVRPPEWDYDHRSPRLSASAACAESSATRSAADDRPVMRPMASLAQTGCGGSSPRATPS